MKVGRWMLLVLLPGLALGAETAVGVSHRLGDSGPWAKPSYSSERLLKLLQHWPPATLSLADTRPEILRAIKTPGNGDLIGMVKHFEVHAPLSRLVEVNDRFEDYPKIWEDVLSVRVEAREQNRVVTDWTRKSPAFFLPKIHLRMVSVSDTSVPGRVVYRHQLIEGNMVNSSDSLVVFEQLAADRTRVSVLNFFDPKVGPFRALAEGKIWRRSLEHGFKDDVAFRARAEHPDWDSSRITEEADRVLDQFPIDQVEYTDLIRFD